MKSKCLAVGIILLFVGTCIIPTIAQNAEKLVSASKGTWLYVGGSGPGNYSRIQDAIDNASDGDTVLVFSGVYMENVYLNKSINLFGENRETTIIDANKSGSTISLGTYNVMISGFTIQDSEDGCAGIDINYYWPPHDDCNNNIISGNKIINNNFGVQISYSSNNSIINNVIILNRRHGVLYQNCELSKVENNIITNNAEAGCTGDAGIYLLNSNYITVRSNYIDGNSVSIDLYGTYSCDISENSLSNNSAMGIFILGHNNRFYSNNFIGNTKDVTFIHNLFFPLQRNRFIKNYWDCYNGTGYQVIVGRCFLFIPTLIAEFIYTIIEGYPADNPIYIKWLYFDLHPAQEPYDIPGMT